MSLSIVRRLTAVLALAAILCLAAPAAAAPAHRAAAGASLVFGSVLFDQLLGWLGRLWSGEPQAVAPAEKEVTPISASGEPEAHPTGSENEGSGTIDPNG
jgi:hypothetical protein